LLGKFEFALVMAKYNIDSNDEASLKRLFSP